MSKYIYGFQPVLEIIKTDSAKIDTIFIANNLAFDKKQKLLALIKEKGIPFKIYPREGLERLLKKERLKAVHQGVIARLKIFEYVELEDILVSKTIVVLDHIQDPQNLGNIIRTACAFDVGGIILPKDRAVGVTPSVIKASAGMVFKTKIVRVTNLAQTLDKLKVAGYWIVGTVAKEGKPIWEVDVELPLAIVIGHEHKGISRLIKQKCDFLITIPMKEDIDSLNVAAATAICLYEIFRKRYG